MEYAKITVKSEYEKRGDLVLRSYVRAVHLLNINLLFDSNNAYIYGIVDDNGDFYEYFTGNFVDYCDYNIIDSSEYSQLLNINEDDKKLLTGLMDKVLFNKKNDLQLDIASVDELALDRKVEMDAYDKFLSRINPYNRLTNQTNYYNDYNNFLRKIFEIKKMKELDSFPYESDEYEVLENPKKLIRK